MTQQECNSISPENLRDSLKDTSQNIKIIDVREPGEFRGCHIPEAVNIPIGNINADTTRPFISSSLVICCQSGARAKQAAKKLSETHEGEINILKGGMNSWKKCSYAVKEDSTAPISMQRQVQIVAGSFVAIGTLLGVTVNPWFLALPGFVGCGLVFAGITNTCGLAMVLGMLPYNR